MRKAIIVDIDGTLSHGTGRDMFDYSRVSEDRPDPAIVDLVSRYSHIDEVLLVTGRNEICREATEKWLQDHMVFYDALYMRKDEDRRPDTVIKTEIYNEHIKGKYDVLLVVEDRTRVVKMWRELGLKCLQVQDGDY